MPQGVLLAKTPYGINIDVMVSASYGVHGSSYVGIPKPWTGRYVYLKNKLDATVWLYVEWSAVKINFRQSNHLKAIWKQQ